MTSPLSSASKTVTREAASDSLKAKTAFSKRRLTASRPGHQTIPTAEAGGKKGPSYRPLPVEFRSGGFNYRQIAREDDVAIYEQTWSGCDNPSVCYEVIRVRRRDGFRIGTRFVEPAEIYPKSEAWGVDGFTLPDKDAAFEKLREICR